MKSIYTRFLSLALFFVLVSSISSVSAQTIVSGISATTPFITPTTNVTAKISNGAGVLRAPRAAKAPLLSELAMPVQGDLPLMVQQLMLQQRKPKGNG